MEKTSHAGEGKAAKLLRLFPPEAGGSCLPPALVEQPAAERKAGLCGVPSRCCGQHGKMRGGWARTNQDILDCYHDRWVPGLMDPGVSARELCVSSTVIYLCVVLCQTKMTQLFLAIVKDEPSLKFLLHFLPLITFIRLLHFL